MFAFDDLDALDVSTAPAPSDTPGYFAPVVSRWQSGSSSRGGVSVAVIGEPRTGVTTLAAHLFRRARGRGWVEDAIGIDPRDAIGDAFGDPAVKENAPGTHESVISDHLDDLSVFLMLNGDALTAISERVRAARVRGTEVGMWSDHFPPSGPEHVPDVRNVLDLRKVWRAGRGFRLAAYSGGVERGRELAHALTCDVCFTVDEPGFAHVEVWRPVTIGPDGESRASPAPPEEYLQKSGKSGPSVAAVRVRIPDFRVVGREDPRLPWCGLGSEARGANSAPATSTGIGMSRSRSGRLLPLLHSPEATRCCRGAVRPAGRAAAVHGSACGP